MAISLEGTDKSKGGGNVRAGGHVRGRRVGWNEDVGMGGMGKGGGEGWG